MPLIGFVPSAGMPSVTVISQALGALADGEYKAATHAHDFLQILYIEAGRHSLRVEDQDWVLTSGDAFVIAPGTVIATGDEHTDQGTEMWTVLVSTDAIDPTATTLLTSWRAHPLLSSFASTRRGGHRIRVPAADRGTCLANITALNSELLQRGNWYSDAVRAHLTLLLIQLSRLEVDLAFNENRDSLVAAVFGVIETRYQQPISLNDVALAVAHSKGHLATVVKNRTGRSVGQWITERRMREARRLLTDTNLSIKEIAIRVGYHDPGYFIRRFRSEHQLTPQVWRIEGRRTGGEPACEAVLSAHRN